MYTIKLLAPFLMGVCANNFLEGQGEYCNPRQTNPSVVKYYEPGKACYIEGVFYKSCPKMSYLK